MREFTYRELQECAAREVKQRARVYPRLIASGRMSQSFADLETEKMMAIAEHFDGLAKRQEAEGRLI